MASDTADAMTPFLSIWTEPRATIRRIVDSDPTRDVLALAAAGPGLFSLFGQWSAAINGPANQSVLWPLFVAFNVAFQAGLGILFLYISGGLFRWSGGLLGGTASSVEVRAALAWSQLPSIVMPVVLILALFAGVPMPRVVPGHSIQFDAALYRVVFVAGVLGVWGFFINLKCLGEVHRFSAWRALAAILIPGLIVFVVLGFAVFLFVLIVARHH